MPGKKVVEFGANGETISESEAPEEVTETPEEGEEPDEEQEPAEGDEGTEPNPDDEEETETPPAKPEGKYRIGDKYFKTEAEALAYADAQENPAVNPLDAYRQGIRDAATAANPPASVTPDVTQDEDFNEEEYYANPGEYMKKRDAKLIAKAAATINQQNATREQGNAIWNEFSSRHPDLAEFRAETEEYVANNKISLGEMVQTKGRPATLDYIALKLKAQFRKYQSIGKPARVLNNGGGGPSPTGTGRGVTPKQKAEKPMTFAEEVRQNRKVR